MELLVATGGLTPKAIYAMIHSEGVKKVSECDGQLLTIDKHIVYQDSDGKMVTIITDVKGKTYVSNSKTFCRDFKDIIDLFTVYGEKVKVVKIVSGKSNGGRTYYSCLYVS